MIKEVKRGEIYFADLEPTRGSEQGGCRPVLIIQNDKGNHYSPTTIIAAITSRRGSHLATHVYLSLIHIYPSIPAKSSLLVSNLPSNPYWFWILCIIDKLFTLHTHGCHLKSAWTRYITTTSDVSAPALLCALICSKCIFLPVLEPAKSEPLLLTLG